MSTDSKPGAGTGTRRAAPHAAFVRPGRGHTSAYALGFGALVLLAAVQGLTVQEIGLGPLKVTFGSSSPERPGTDADPKPGGGGTDAAGAPSDDREGDGSRPGADEDATTDAAVEVRSDACADGFVWREAAPDDHVCVLPETRRQVREDNAAARSRIDPDGAHGPESCISGYVWREAFGGDVVCVSPETRDRAATDNAAAASRLRAPDG